MTPEKLIDFPEGAREEAERVVKYCEDPQHWYRPGPDVELPGNVREQTMFFDFGNEGVYKCAFSITEHEGRLWRHLSVSVYKQNRAPIPAFVFEIADLLGFRGYEGQGRPGANWACDYSEELQVAAVLEPYSSSPVGQA